MNKARVISVYDGDTINCDVTYPIIKKLRAINEQKIRIYGIDTPEIRTKNLDEKALGYKVRDYVRSIIDGKEVELLLVVDNDKYGRLLAYVFIDDMDLGEHLISIGYAKEYYGGTKQKW